jgi:beta-galactosidase/beta-glucuronidase
VPDADCHPRPQLARERWIDLTGPWGFAYDDDDVGMDQDWMHRTDVFDSTITVPFPPESRASGIGRTEPHSVLWYRRTFEVAGADRSGRLLLGFGAVDYRAEVWVNGRSVARHEGGHTTFVADVTAALDPGREQVLVVRAEDTAGDRRQPRGKQYWGDPPADVWYHRTSGIWQPVWVEPVPATYIASVQWDADPALEQIRLRTQIRHRPRGRLRLRVELRAHGGVLVDDEITVLGDEVDRSFMVPTGAPSITHSGALLWSPEHPNLIDARLTLLDDDGSGDTVESYLGYRSLRTRDGMVELNGSPYFLRMVLAQGYWPESHLAAPDENALRREVEAIKSLGFNGVRVHQKVEDPRFLHWCDRLGLLVWVEMPSAYECAAVATGRLTREWIEVLERDRSHPCVAAWITFNESWGVPNLLESASQQALVGALRQLTDALDGTRPVLANDGWEVLASDIVGIHDYTTSGARLRARYEDPEALRRTFQGARPNFHRLTVPGFDRGDRPVVLSEFGGITLGEDDGSRAAYGYGAVEDAAGLLEKYRELVGAALSSTALAGFCYTQLTDVEHEINGLLTAQRVPKVDPEAIRAVNQFTAAAVPAEAMLAQILAYDGPSGKQAGRRRSSPEPL